MRTFKRKSSQQHRVNRIARVLVLKNFFDIIIQGRHLNQLLVLSLLSISKLCVCVCVCVCVERGDTKTYSVDKRNQQILMSGALVILIN